MICFFKIFKSVNFERESHISKYFMVYKKIFGDFLSVFWFYLKNHQKIFWKLFLF